MVYGHAAKSTSFVALFHMSIFFVASGYCYKNNTRTLKDLVEYMKKKLVTLWVPFLLFNGAFIILHNFFIRLNVYTNHPLFLQECNNSITKLHIPFDKKDIFENLLKNLLFQSDTQMGGALWFLQTLFFTTIIYGVIDWLLCSTLKDESKCINIQLLIAVIFLCLGYYCSLHGITAKHLNRVFTCYWMLWFGVFLKSRNLMDRIYKWLPSGVVFVGATLILIIMAGMGSISLSGNNYENPFFLIICSVTGWLMMYSLGDIIENLEAIKAGQARGGNKRNANSSYIFKYPFYTGDRAAFFII